MIGQCKLCLSEKNLQESHYLPKSIYKRLRDEDKKNPNPVVLTKKKPPIQTSRQEWAHLLCSDCEQRFNKYGEHWVVGHCKQNDGSFPLKSILTSRIPDISSNTNPTKIYYASKIPEINITALAYFAASLFWRGSIYPWKNDGSIPVNLGPFQERFRQYLIGDPMDLKAFPKDCSLWVTVRDGKMLDRMTFTPDGGRQDNFHSYQFPMPGLAFTLLVGKNIPLNYREWCLVHGFGNPIIITTIIDKLLENLALTYHIKTEKF